MPIETLAGTLVSIYPVAEFVAGNLFLILIALAGFGASFIDGALGMGFGVTSTSLLLAVGLTPALASASVHLAKIATGTASGIAHHRFGNVDWTGVKRIGLPGAVGAFVGSTVLSHLSTKAALPFTGTLLFLLGIYIVIRFVRGRAPLAAWLVRFLNARILGVVVGCFILLLNARLILGALDPAPAVWWAVYAALVTVSLITISYVVLAVSQALLRSQAGAKKPC